MEGFVRQVVFCFQKKGKLDLVRKNTIEKNSQKKNETKKTIEPKSFTKSDEQFKRCDFQKKKKPKINKRDSKNRKIGININRRNTRENK